MNSCLALWSRLEFTDNFSFKWRLFKVVRSWWITALITKIEDILIDYYLWNFSLGQTYSAYLRLSCLSRKLWVITLIKCIFIYSSLEVSCHIKIRVLSSSSYLLSITTVTIRRFQNRSSNFFSHFIFFKLIFQQRNFLNFFLEERVKCITN